MTLTIADTLIISFPLLAKKKKKSFPLYEPEDNLLLGTKKKNKEKREYIIQLCKKELTLDFGLDSVQTVKNNKLQNKKKIIVPVPHVCTETVTERGKKGAHCKWSPRNNQSTYIYI